MTEKIWLKSYPPGVPADIDPSRYRSLKELAEQASPGLPERNAYVQMGRKLSLSASSTELSRAFGAWLQNSAGLQQGRIASRS